MIARMATLAAMAGLAVQAKSLQTGAPFPGFNNMGVYIEKNFDWSNIENEFKSAISAGYKRLYIGFYMSMYGATGGATGWESLDANTRADLKNFAASNNAEIVLSVGGPGEYTEGVLVNGSATGFGTAAAQYAKTWGYDGLDFSVHLSGEATSPSVWANNGSFAGYVHVLVVSAKGQGFGVNDISITANAPYFSPQYIQSSDPAVQQQNSLSWFALNQNSDMDAYVTKINLVMFNEQDNYMSYQNIFVKNTYNDPYYGVYGAGSAVMEIANLGIDSGKIAIVKPISPDESSVKDGYLSPATLGPWGCQAYAEYGWVGGYIGWTWNSDDTYNTLNWPGLLNTC